MTRRAPRPISDHLAWAQWWAFPWKPSHQSWRSAERFPAIDALERIASRLPKTIAAIAPCLPPAPQPTEVRLALASTEQLNLMLALLHTTCRPEDAAPISKSHHQWCIGLSKALPPDMLLHKDDPLQLLRSWVKPDTWQRLRLRFPCERVLEMEKNTLSLEHGNSRLNTLWQAIVWRATATPHAPPGSHEQGA
ncbi:hypothetical protein SAMN04490207_2645 [Pseudomonas gessardii]|nr:hypothetical protein SAMN04490207_2645 [Pseudomonas gessardii]